MGRRRIFIATISALLLSCCSNQEVSRDEADSPEAAPADDCDTVLAEANRRDAEAKADPTLSDDERKIALIRIWARTGQCGMRPVGPHEPEPQDISESLAEIYRDAMQAARSVGGGTRECRAAIGDNRADALEAACSQVSAATHPPCSAANECELLVDEIDRNCDEWMRDRFPRLCSIARGDTDD